MEEQRQSKKHVISITTKTCMRLGTTFFLVYLAVTWWKPLLNVLGKMINASAPLLIGFALAYMVDILMSVYEKHYFRKRADEGWVKKSRRIVCMIGAIATILGAIVLLLGIVVPQLMNALTVITHKIPGLLKELSENQKVMEILPEGIQDAIRKLDYQALVEGIVSFLTNGASTSKSILSLTSALGTLTSGFMTGFMGFIFSIYILTGKEKLARQFQRLFHSYLSAGWMNRINPVLSVADECFHSFIVGQITEGVIIGVLCAIGMWICRLPYAAMIGAVVGVTALIPIMGCYLGAGVGALMCLSVSPWKAVEFLVFIFVLQQLEDNLIYPRVVGTSLGLPGIWVLASVAVGGGIGGIVGMILSVPIAATIYQLIRLDVQRREREEGAHMTAADVVGKLKQDADR
jgi:predicted PurR-regulated permease PerM